MTMEINTTVVAVSDAKPKGSAKITRQILRANGNTVELDRRVDSQFIRKQIKAETFDCVLLRHMGDPLHVMILDDDGHNKKLPINEKATEIYHKNCRPGTTHKIRGDVVIAPDSDFGSH